MYFDLRPRENCPCYSNFQSKSIEELARLLKTALENQIKDLEENHPKNKYYKEAKATLTNQLEKAVKLLESQL